MKLYDGTGEYVRVDELKPGDRVRTHEEGADGERVWREVLVVNPGIRITGVACTDGFGWEEPSASRILKKTAKP